MFCYIVLRNCMIRTSQMLISRGEESRVEGINEEVIIFPGGGWGCRSGVRVGSV